VYRFSKVSILLALTGLIAVFGIACSSSSNSPESTVAATVNGKKIMLQEVERIIHQQSQGKESLLSAHDLATNRLNVLDKLIQREVLYQRAEQEKLLPTEEEISNAINKQKQDNAMTDEDFARYLKEQNLTMEALREDAKKNLAMAKLEDKYASKITISDREVEDFYIANKQQFVNARGVALAMIMVDPTDNSQQGITKDDAKNEADAKTKIDGINQQLKSGADFATVARMKSEDANSVLRGGDVGFATEEDLKRTGFPSELIASFFGSMQVGDRTDPVRFPSGQWYIFKLQEKQLQTENLTLEGQFANGESVRHRITGTLTNQRKEILNNALIEVAMTEAKIVNNLATEMLNNPGNLGLRPAGYDPSKVAGSPTPAAAATTSPAASATTSPAKK
jgi:parvulin-like peptidyl-prolyl isomerase